MHIWVALCLWNGVYVSFSPFHYIHFHLLFCTAPPTNAIPPPPPRSDETNPDVTPLNPACENMTVAEPFVAPVAVPAPKQASGPPFPCNPSTVYFVPSPQVSTSQLSTPQQSRTSTPSKSHLQSSRHAQRRSETSHPQHTYIYILRGHARHSPPPIHQHPRKLTTEHPNSSKHPNWPSSPRAMCADA